MNSEEILEKYGLTRAVATNYIDAITRLNQTDTAEEIGVSRDTVNRYKKAFARMPGEERAFLIASLFQEELLGFSFDSDR